MSVDGVGSSKSVDSGSKKETLFSQHLGGMEQNLRIATAAGTSNVNEARPRRGSELTEEGNKRDRSNPDDATIDGRADGNFQIAAAAATSIELRRGQGGVLNCLWME